MDAYIIGGYRSAVGKAKKGGFRFTRPDDLAVSVIGHLLNDFPQLDQTRIDDLIVGNAMPEAEQGLNVARLISLMSLNTDQVPGMTVNRYCASGLEALAIAASKIHSGMSDCIIAGGTESMTAVPMGGWRVVPHAGVGKKNPTWYWSMGLTAEAVAREFNISREDQDAFAFESHNRALHAIDTGLFKADIAPVTVEQVYLDKNEKRQTRSFVVDTDEGPRRGTSTDALARLRPVFAQNGSVTAGNASQTSDGAAFLMVVSENMLKELKAEPIARICSYHAAGVAPRIMGIGPVAAVPKAIERAGLTMGDIDLFELNEAFASQSVAVLRELDLNPEIVNVNGGAIALGHPLGCTGAKLSVQLLNEMRRRGQRYGVVTMCVGTGQGAAGVFELLN